MWIEICCWEKREKAEKKFTCRKTLKQFEISLVFLLFYLWKLIKILFAVWDFWWVYHFVGIFFWFGFFVCVIQWGVAFCWKKDWIFDNLLWISLKNKGGLIFEFQIDGKISSTHRFVKFSDTFSPTTHPINIPSSNFNFSPSQKNILINYTFLIKMNFLLSKILLVYSRISIFNWDYPK